MADPFTLFLSAISTASSAFGAAETSRAASNQQKAIDEQKKAAERKEAELKTRQKDERAVRDATASRSIHRSKQNQKRAAMRGRAGTILTPSGLGQNTQLPSNQGGKTYLGE
jgi:hypothetical protein